MFVYRLSFVYHSIQFNVLFRIYTIHKRIMVTFNDNQHYDVTLSFSSPKFLQVQLLNLVTMASHSSFKNGSRTHGQELNGVYRKHNDLNMGQNEPHVLALDIGTTTIRCYVYDRDMLVKGSASRKVSNIT